MKQLQRMIKGVALILPGIFLIVCPGICSLIGFGPINWAEAVKLEPEKRFVVGICSIVVGLVIIVLAIHWIKRICVIEIDGLDGTELVNKKPKSIFKKHTVRYCGKIGNNNHDGILDSYNRICNMYNDNKNRNYNCYYFFGIGYIPFIFLLGSLYGDDAKKYKFIHSFRIKKNKIAVLPRKNKNNKCTLKMKYQKYNDNSKSSDLIVMIATSFDMDMELDSYFDGLDILKIDSSEKNVDVVDNMNLLNLWAQNIASEIRKYSSEYNVVHLFLNTSSCMVFKLGTLLNNNYDIPIRVYHYDRKAKKRRPWSICVSSKRIDDHVIMTK